jgi:hypothetical protein
MSKGRTLTTRTLTACEGEITRLTTLQGRICVDHNVASSKTRTANWKIAVNIKEHMITRHLFEMTAECLFRE